MGDAGKKIGQGVGQVALGLICNIVYGGIKVAQEYGKLRNNNSPVPEPKPEEKEGLKDIVGVIPPDIEQHPKNAEKEEVKEKEEEKEEARDITNQQATTARKAAYQAAINAGVTPAQAQAAADAQTPAGNYAGNYAALAGAGAAARAAYRERQGYADALDRETKNLEESRKREIIAAALSGGAAGAGISLF